MVDELLIKQVETIAEELVLADPGDLQGLANLHTIFQEIEQKTSAHASAIAKNCAALVERIILAEVPDSKIAMETLGKGVAALQGILRDGRALHEVDLPEELRPSEALDQSPAEKSQVSKAVTLSGVVDEKILSDFLARQPAVLEDMERLLLELENSDVPSSKAELRRIIHTLKGESGLIGLPEVERLCHTAEDAIDKVPIKEITDILLEMKDWLGRVFHALSTQGEMPESTDNLIQRLGGCTSSDKASSKDSEKTEEVSEATQPPQSEPKYLTADKDLLAEFVTEAQEHLQNADVQLLTVETDSKNQEALNAVFRAFHTIKGVAGFLDLPDIQSLAHEAENLLDRARKNELELVGPYMDVTFESVDMMKRLVAHVAHSLSTGEPLGQENNLPDLMKRLHQAVQGQLVAEARSIAAVAPGKRIGEILTEQGKVSPQEIAETLEKQSAMGSNGELEQRPKVGEMLVREGKVSAQEVAAGLRAQKQSQPSPAEMRNQGVSTEVKEPVRVDADRLDRLVDLIGELVIAESMVSQSPELTANASNQLLRHLSQLDKITRELQEIGMSLRMVAVRATFQKMARLVRDLSRKANKNVRFEMYGEDTELDKSVVDKIGDPLVHMIRNAVDHGIESDPAERIAAGKSEAGLVVLRAYHSGGSICIEVQDDGRGLDKEAILRKGIERGLVREGENLTEREIFNLIFEPGFSTAKQITDVSGRGVGMDVVRKNIEALRGQVEIHSEKGKGTLFNIRLPLTLAIIDGMVVRAGAERYILPTLSVVRAIRPKKEEIFTVVNKGEMLSIQGRLIPLFRLDRLFSVQGAVQDATQALAVIVEDDGRQAGILVDELLGQQQTVIKSLGDAMRGIMGISGGAIMSDGTVGLIVDVAGLLRLTNVSENAEHISSSTGN